MFLRSYDSSTRRHCCWHERELVDNVVDDDDVERSYPKQIIYDPLQRLV